MLQYAPTSFLLYHSILLWLHTGMKHNFSASLPAECLFTLTDICKAVKGIQSIITVFNVVSVNTNTI